MYIRSTGRIRAINIIRSYCQSNHLRTSTCLQPRQVLFQEISTNIASPVCTFLKVESCDYTSSECSNTGFGSTSQSIARFSKSYLHTTSKLNQRNNDDNHVSSIPTNDAPVYRETHFTLPHQLNGSSTQTNVTLTELKHINDELEKFNSLLESTLKKSAPSASSNTIDQGQHVQQNLHQEYLQFKRRTLKDMANCIQEAQRSLERLEPTFALPHSNHAYKPNINRFNNNGDNNSSSGDNLDVLTAQISFDKEVVKACESIIQAYADCLQQSQELTHVRFVRGFPQRAQQLLQHLPQPTTKACTAVIKAWACSDEPMRGSRANDVFANTIATVSKCTNVADAYFWIITAWSNSRGERRRAFNATSHLIKWLRLVEDRKLRVDEGPSLSVYHLIFRVYVTAEEKLTPVKAQYVLKLMTQAYQRNLSYVQPDVTCFSYLLQTVASRPELSSSGLMADRLLMQMKQNFHLIPNTICYGAAIRTWKQVALSPTETVYHPEICANRCLELLEEMQEAHQRTALFSVRVQTSHVNDVLEALTACDVPTRILQAEKLMHDLEKGVFGENVQPDADSYRFMLQNLSKETSQSKLQRALNVLDQFQKNCLSTISKSTLNNKVACNKIVEVINSFIRLCAASSNLTKKKPGYGFILLQRALSATETLRLHSQLYPNAATYTALLDCCNQLLGPQEPEKSVLVERIFKICCDEGMVDGTVLNQFRKSTTTEQFHRIVTSQSEIVEGIAAVPDDWVRNTLGGRVKTQDGRKTAPLNLHGKVTITKAMHDFRMRRLREKRNRSLLEGGRLKQKPVYADPFNQKQN